jgi:hypothetical protein
MRIFRTSFTAIAVAILAVACGGGGDGGGSGGDVIPPPPTEVLISAANQDTVARASLASIVPFSNVPVAPGGAQASAAAPRGGLAWLALQSVKASVRQTAPTPAGMARPLALYQETVPCTISGTMTIGLDDKDNNGTISAGDSMSVTLNQCVDDIGSTINGGLAMAISSYSLSPVAEEMIGSMTFQALTVVDPSGSFSMSGGFHFNIRATQTAQGILMAGSYMVGVGGADSLVVSKQGGSGGLSDTFTYRAGYEVLFSALASSVPGVGSESITANGKFRSEALGGELTLKTVTPFTSDYTEATAEIFPTTGQLIATGRNNTALGLTATGTVQARMDMCDDGDGAWEASKMMPWDALYQ